LTAGYNFFRNRFTNKIGPALALAKKVVDHSQGAGTKAGRRLLEINLLTTNLRTSSLFGFLLLRDELARERFSEWFIRVDRCRHVVETFGHFADPIVGIINVA
jgi:hypothetical protein